MNTAGLLDLLHASLSEAYPTYRAVSHRPGRVTTALEATGADFDAPVCQPVPFILTVDVHILAAGNDEQAIKDLPHHVEPVAALIRQAGFGCESWRASATETVPEIVITATAPGVG